MSVDAIRAVHVVVGLGAGVAVTDVQDRRGGPLVIGIELESRPCCWGCGGPVWAHGSSRVRLVDLPAFGRPVRLVWRKRRWRCPDGSCEVRTFTDQQPKIAPPRARVTSRAARHATRRAGAGRAISEIAAGIGCGWHTVMRAVHRWGAALLEADTARIDGVTALGLDEILLFRRGRWRDKHWGTTIAGNPTRHAARHSPRSQRPRRHRMDRCPVVSVARTDPLGSHGPVGSVPQDVHRGAAARPAGRGPLPCDQARQHRGRRRAPPRAERDHRRAGHQRGPAVPDTKTAGEAAERVTERGKNKLRGLLAAGDPHSEVRDAWHAKETLRGVYRIPSRAVAVEALDELARDLQDDTFSPELNKLGRTLAAWRTQITNWHRSSVTNGPTEAANNLAKLIKRTSFGITNFDHYRTRVLLYAGKPDWTLLDTLTPR